MPDYDVAAVSLASPPSLGALTTYRPAVLVRNNGIHDALATGYVRAYKAGRLVFESEVYSPTIPPGETRQATAVDYWTPDAVGQYMFQGFVSAPLDSVPANNQLAPTTVTITAIEPPPPPIVTVHASQHEEGGDDEVSIDGLRGLAADEQHPRDHATNHETGGDDELSVDGLTGTLATPQPTAAHANEKHTVPFSTVAEMTAHQLATTAHDLATNLEKTANKGAANGYAPLGTDSKVPTTNLPPLGSAAPIQSRELGFISDVLTVKEIVRLDFGPGLPPLGRGFHFDALGWIHPTVGAQPSLVLQWSDDADTWNPLAAFPLGTFGPTVEGGYLDCVIDGVIRPTEYGPEPHDFAVTSRIINSTPAPGATFQPANIMVAGWLRNMNLPPTQYRYVRACIDWNTNLGTCSFMSARLVETTSELQTQEAFNDVEANTITNTNPAQVGVPMGVTGVAKNVGDVTAAWVTINMVIHDALGNEVLNQTSGPLTINVTQSESFGVGLIPTMPGMYTATATVVWAPDENLANNVYTLQILVAP